MYYKITTTTDNQVFRIVANNEKQAKEIVDKMVPETTYTLTEITHEEFHKK